MRDTAFLGRFLAMLVSLPASAPLLGCSAHDIVMPNVNEGVGGAGGARGDGGPSSDGPSGDPGTASADCNLRGVWMTRMVTVTQALQMPQYANSWYYLEIDQPDGSTEFAITRAFDCGIEVHGSVRVTLLPATLEAHMKHNSQVGRKGTMKKRADGQCVLESEVFWVLLGAADRFLPPRNAAEEVEPVARRLPLPTLQNPDGAEDWDGDGKLGVGWQVSGVLQGSRNTVQRQWNKWFTNDAYSITPASDWGDILVRVDFDKDETVFDPTEGLLISASYSVRTPETPNRYLLRFLGRDRSDPRAQAIVRGIDPEGATADTIATCHAMQDTLAPEDM